MPMTIEERLANQTGKVVAMQKRIVELDAEVKRLRAAMKQARQALNAALVGD